MWESISWPQYSCFHWKSKQDKCGYVRQVNELIKWIIGSQILQKYCYLYPKHDPKVEEKNPEMSKSILKILMCPMIPEITSTSVLFSTINGQIYNEKQLFIS